MGRPSKFQEVFIEQAEKLALLGATDVEIANFFEVDPDTIYEWKKKHPEFSEALKKGKEEADMKVATSLYNRAIGYECIEYKDVMYKGAMHRLESKRHVPADTLSAIFWLKNRRPNEWRDKREFEGNIKTDTEFAIILTDAETSPETE